MASLDSNYVACLTDAHLICSLCDGPLRKPVVLPCFHVFCTTCLEGNLEQNKTEVRKCPTCNVRLTKESKKQQPVQFLQTLQEVIKSKRFEQKPCGFCDKEKYAVWYCKRCDDNLCGQCKSTHANLKGKEKHRDFEFLDETVKDICQRRNDFYCEDHSEEILAYYCTTCSKSVCVVCESAYHDTHDTTRLSQMADHLRKDLSVAVNQLIAELQEKKEETDARERRFEENKTAVEIDIKRWVETLKNAVDRKAEELLKKYIEVCRPTGRKKNPEMETSSEEIGYFPKQLSDYGSDVEVINLAETVVCKLKDIKTKETPVQDIDTNLLKFIPEIKSSSLYILSIGKISKEGEYADGIKDEDLKTDNDLKSSQTQRQKHLLASTNTVTSFQAEWDVTGISVNSQKEYLINSRLKKACLVYTSSGNLVREVQTRGQNPFDVTVLKNGDYVMTDREAKKVNVFSPEGNFLETLKLEIGEPGGIAVLSNGDMVISDLKQKDVCVFSPHRKLFPIKSLKTENGNRTFKWPMYVAVNSMDEIIVSDNELHSVKIFNKHGKFRSQYGCYGEDGQNLRGPRGICTDSSDYIFVTDYTNDRIHLLNPEGKFVRILIGRENGLTGPRVVTVDGSGRLVVCQENATVKIIDYKQ